MAINSDIHCHQCGATAPEARSTFNATLPTGWMRFQGTSDNALNIVIRLCPTCAPPAGRQPSMLDIVGGLTDPA
jgi:hypothetical protein